MPDQTQEQVQWQDAPDVSGLKPATAAPAIQWHDKPDTSQLKATSEPKAIQWHATPDVSQLPTSVPYQGKRTDELGAPPSGATKPMMDMHPVNVIRDEPVPLFARNPKEGTGEAPKPLPKTFSEQPIPSWDTDAQINKALTIPKRMGATTAKAGGELAEGFAAAPQAGTQGTVPAGAQSNFGTMMETARKERPNELGIAKGVGETVGGVVGDPTNWALALTGAEAGPVLSRLISGAFAAKMGKDAYAGTKELVSNWDNLTPEERSEQITKLGINGLFSTAAAYHAAGSPDSVTLKETAGIPVRVAAKTADVIAGTPVRSFLKKVLPSEAAPFVSEHAHIPGRTFGLEPSAKTLPKLDAEVDAATDRLKAAEKQVKVSNDAGLEIPARDARALTAAQQAWTDAKGRRQAASETVPMEKSISRVVRGIEPGAGYELSPEARRHMTPETINTMDQVFNPSMPLQPVEALTNPMTYKVKQGLRKIGLMDEVPEGRIPGWSYPEIPAAEDITARPARPTPKAANVNGPGEVAPEHIGRIEPLLDKPVVGMRQMTLPNEQGTMGKQNLLSADIAKTTADVMPKVDNAIAAVEGKAAPEAIPARVKPADLERQVRESLGGTPPLEPNAPIRMRKPGMQEVPKAEAIPARGEKFYHGSTADTEPEIQRTGKITSSATQSGHLTPDRSTAEAYAKQNGGKVHEVKASNVPDEALAHYRETGRGPIQLGPEHEVPSESVEKKLSSRPDKAMLQQSGASEEDIAKILPMTRVELSKLAGHFDVDLGDKAIGRGKGDVAAGTHLPREQVLQKIVDAGHSPADIAKAIDEGKHFPGEVGGGSQGADRIGERTPKATEPTAKQSPTEMNPKDLREWLEHLWKSEEGAASIPFTGDFSQTGRGESTQTTSSRNKQGGIEQNDVNLSQQVFTRGKALHTPEDETAVADYRKETAQQEHDAKVQKLLDEQPFNPDKKPMTPAEAERIVSKNETEQQRSKYRTPESKAPLKQIRNLNDDTLAAIASEKSRFYQAVEKTIRSKGVKASDEVREIAHDVIADFIGAIRNKEIEGLKASSTDKGPIIGKWLNTTASRAAIDWMRKGIDTGEKSEKGYARTTRPSQFPKDRWTVGKVTNEGTQTTDVAHRSAFPSEVNPKFSDTTEGKLQAKALQDHLKAYPDNEAFLNAVKEAPGHGSSTFDPTFKLSQAQARIIGDKFGLSAAQVRARLGTISRDVQSRYFGEPHAPQTFTKAKEGPAGGLGRIKPEIAEPRPRTSPAPDYSKGASGVKDRAMTTGWSKPEQGVYPSTIPEAIPPRGRVTNQKGLDKLSKQLGGEPKKFNELGQQLYDWEKEHKEAQAAEKGQGAKDRRVSNRGTQELGPSRIPPRTFMRKLGTSAPDTAEVRLNKAEDRLHRAQQANMKTLSKTESAANVEAKAELVKAKANLAQAKADAEAERVKAQVTRWHSLGAATIPSRSIPTTLGESYPRRSK